MKILKLFSLFLITALVFNSCAKEDIIETTDNTPSIDPEEEIVEENNNSFSIFGISMVVDTAYMSAAQGWGSNEIFGYVLNIDNSIAGVPGFLFAMNYEVDLETAPQAGTYTGGTASTFTQEAADAIEEWINNGADPLSVPDLSDLFYDASNVTIDVSNVNLSVYTEQTEFPDPDNPGQTITLTGHIDEADVSLSGYLLDSDDNEVPMSGTFLAQIKRVEF